MTTSPVCSHCGSPIPEASVHGLCPRCVFARAMQPTANTVCPPSPPPSLEAVREAFRHLEVISLIGSGGMGSVFQARQPQLDRFVALKILPAALADQPGFSGRFHQEAKALARLNHPHIVTVHDYGQSGGFYYLLMEYVDGVNLRQLLQSRRLTPKEALSIVPPVCDALQCAHDHGIVHRDIKPENLLIDRTGIVKIADFGIAKIVGADSNEREQFETGPAGATGSVTLGTPDYAAPEQANGTADHRADIYSLGVVLYEMLTGERPKEAIEAPSRRVQVDIRIDEIVLRALDANPNLRFATAAEFRARVEAVTGDTAPPAGAKRSSSDPRSAWKPGLQPPGPRRIAGILTLLAGVLLLGGSQALNEFVDDAGLTTSARDYLRQLRQTVQAATDARKAATDANVRLNAAKERQIPSEIERLTREANALQIQATLADSAMNQAAVNKAAGEQRRITWFVLAAGALIVTGGFLLVRIRGPEDPSAIDQRSGLRPRRLLIPTLILVAGIPAILVWLSATRQRRLQAVDLEAARAEMDRIRAMESASNPVPGADPSVEDSRPADENVPQQVVVEYPLHFIANGDPASIAYADLRNLLDQIRESGGEPDTSLVLSRHLLIVRAHPANHERIAGLIESLRQKLSPLPSETPGEP